MKKVAKWVGVWFLWILVVLLITAVIAEPIFTKEYSKLYSDIVEERNELYSQVDSLNGNFEEVYNMRNAEIINSEEPVVVLKSDRFTLKVKFSQDRMNIIGIEEMREISATLWMIAVLMVATLLYIAYSVGKLCANNWKNKILIDKKGRYQE